jgi:hypothetical protein
MKEYIPFYNENQEINDFIARVHASEPAFPIDEYDNKHPCIVLFEPNTETGFLDKLQAARGRHEGNNILTNIEAAEPFAEYYFHTITSMEDVINAFNEVVEHERNINNSFKIIHDYGRIIEEIDRVDNHDNIIYTHSTPLIVDSGLHSIPTIINHNLPQT